MAFFNGDQPHEELGAFLGDFDVYKEPTSPQEPVSPLLFDAAREVISMDTEVPHSYCVVAPPARQFPSLQLPALAESVGAKMDAVVPELKVKAPRSRRRQVPVDEGSKDEKYFAYRSKNTKKAKECRDRKREEKKNAVARLEAAQSHNATLKARTARLELVLADLTMRISQLPQSSF